MDKRVIEFFKRNKDAKLCHLVLDVVFAEGEREKADAYAKSRNATGATIKREDFDKWNKKVKGETANVKADEQVNGSAAAEQK